MSWLLPMVADLSVLTSYHGRPMKPLFKLWRSEAKYFAYQHTVTLSIQRYIGDLSVVYISSLSFVIPLIQEALRSKFTSEGYFVCFHFGPNIYLFLKFSLLL